MKRQKIDRIDGHSRTDNGITLEQLGNIRPYEKAKRSNNELAVGIYEGSETFSIGMHVHYIYESGKTRQFLDSMSIPLKDVETLTVIRDLLNDAIALSPKFQDLDNLERIWSAGIPREDGSWNSFVTVEADTASEATKLAAEELTSFYNTRKLYKAWIEQGGQVRNRGDLLFSSKSVVEKIGDVICPSCREPVDLEEWHSNSGMCVSCKIAKDERIQAQIEVDVPLEIDPEE